MALVIVSAGAITQAQTPDDDPMHEMLISFSGLPDNTWIEDHGGIVERAFSRLNILQVHLPESAISLIETMPGLRSFDSVRTVTLQESVTWNVERVFGTEDYPFATFDVTTGRNVGVAVMDTGIDENHVDLDVVGGVNTINDSHWGEDFDGHGTHVAGILAALQNNQGQVGVAPGVDLYAIKALEGDNGSGTTLSIIDGLDWAMDNEIPIITMSFGLGENSGPLADAVEDAYNAGHLLISSAGNEGDNDGNVLYPAAYDQVIAVSASGSHPLTGNDFFPDFSSYGEEIEFIAPGVEIESTLPGNDYGIRSGTSMAAPHVAGAAALVWSLNEDFTNEQVRQILRDTAEDLGFPGTEQGHGMIRPDLAVQAAVDVAAEYVIEATSGEGGALDPEGTILLEEGESQTFLVLPTSGYVIDEVIVDGNSIGVTESYTFEDVTSDHTIEAIFAPDTFTITFETYDATAVDPITAPYGETIDAPDPPEKEGHSFEGWYEDEDFEQAFVFDTMPDTDMTLYARFEVETYTITFDTGEGTDIEPVDAEYGEALEAPEEPGRAAHVFSHWEKDGERFDFDDATMPAHDFTLIAVYEEKAPPEIDGFDDGAVYEDPVTITFDDAEITVEVNGETVESGATFSEPGHYEVRITDQDGDIFEQEFAIAADDTAWIHVVSLIALAVVALAFLIRKVIT